MRHGKKFNHLGRTAPHRAAMLSNMASSLIIQKRIFTTVAKAKALRQYVEPLLTKAKSDSTHSRRIVFSYLQNKESVKELFAEVADKIQNRPGGYTRIIKTGNRLGDSADMCMMELVDYNELLIKDVESTKSTAKKKRTRRGRSKAKKSEEQANVTEETTAQTQSETIAEDEVVQTKSEIEEETATYNTGEEVHNSSNEGETRDESSDEDDRNENKE